MTLPILNRYKKPFIIKTTEKQTKSNRCYDKITVKVGMSI